jgi:caffeoyl-CoA O-methyltransferase
MEITPEQRTVQQAIIDLYAREDDVLRTVRERSKEAGLPEIQIPEISGKFLQLLVTASRARKILEIGTLGGYSAIWLARALPSGGRLITLEANPKHAEVAQGSFALAGVADLIEVRVGKALDLLPHLQEEAPFDFVFIDADKENSPQYLDWALRLTQSGSMIVADNHIPASPTTRHHIEPGWVEANEAYNKRLAGDPSLVATAIPLDPNYFDGCAVAVRK